MCSQILHKPSVASCSARSCASENEVNKRMAETISFSTANDSNPCVYHFEKEFLFLYLQKSFSCISRIKLNLKMRDICDCNEDFIFLK